MSKIVFTLAAVLALAFVASNGAAHARTSPGWGEITRAPNLTRIVRHLTRPGAVVYCATRNPSGNAGEAVKATREIVLAPDVCAALRAAPRIVTPAYPRVESGFAVFTLAHEAGHLVRSTDEWAESQADCYAAGHWRGYALALGFKRSQLPALAKQVYGECWH